MVAVDTGTDHIFPGMLALTVARDNVVYGKLLALLTAILAGIEVAVENSKPG